MLVVSDTSPVRALHHLGLMHLLEVQFGDVVVPPAVESELKVGSSICAPVDLSAYPFVRVRAPGPIDPALAATTAHLQPGETEAIALAIELRADQLLMDEADGRRAAERLGLVVVGVLGVLLDAKGAGLIPAIGPLVARLRAETRFYVSDSLLRRVLALAGE